MKKRLTCLLSVILVVSLLFSICGIAVYSFDNNVRMTYIDSYYGNINQGLLSTKVKASISGSSSVTSVKIKMELQKLSGGAYSTVATWEQTFSGRSGSMEESKLTSSLSTYRLKATVTAYSGSNSESKEFYAY